MKIPSEQSKTEESNGARNILPSPPEKNFEIKNEKPDEIINFKTKPRKESER